MWIVSFLFETRAMRTKHLPPRPPSARPGHRLLVGSHLLDRRRAMVGREYSVSVQTSIAEIDVLFFLPQIRTRQQVGAPLARVRMAFGCRCEASQIPSEQ